MSQYLLGDLRSENRKDSSFFAFSCTVLLLQLRLIQELIAFMRFFEIFGLDICEDVGIINIAKRNDHTFL